MKRFLFIVTLFVLSTHGVSAAYVAQPENAFEVLPMKNLQAQTIYGRLNDFPHTFTFVVSENTPFSMQVAMNAGQEPRDVSLILVRQEKRGVSEVGRVTGKDATWVEKYDFWRAVTFASSPKQTYTLSSGTYRLEVSAPENNRGYRLIIGTGDSSLPREIFTVRKIFEVSSWGVLLSPFVFVFIFVAMGVLYYRKKRKYVS